MVIVIKKCQVVEVPVKFHWAIGHGSKTGNNLIEKLINFSGSTWYSKQVHCFAMSLSIIKNFFNSQKKTKILPGIFGGAPLSP